MQLSHIFLTVHWWHDRGRPVILPFERKKILKHLLIPASDIPTFFSFLVGLWHGSTSSMMNFLNFSVSGWIWSLMRETTSLTVETPIFLFCSPLVHLKKPDCSDCKKLLALSAFKFYISELEKHQCWKLFTCYDNFIFSLNKL